MLQSSMPFKSVVLSTSFLLLFSITPPEGVAQHRNPAIQAQRQALHRLAQEGNDSLLIARATEFINRTPQDPVLYYFKTLGLLWRMRPSEALPAINTAIALDSTKSGFYLARAQVHRRLHQYEKALFNLDAAVRFGTDPDKTQLTRARIHSEMGVPSKAAKQIRPLLAKHPDSVALKSALSEAKYLAGDVDSALTLLHNSDAARSPTLLRQASNIHLREGHIDDAHEALIALERKTDSARSSRGQAFTKTNLAYTFYKRDSLDAALQRITTGIQILPQNSFAYRNRGLIHRALGHLDEACDDFRRAIDLDFSTQWGQEAIYGPDPKALFNTHCASTD
jgi:tetratricopeptide (TPR) repeat protein